MSKKVRHTGSRDKPTSGCVWRAAGDDEPCFGGKAAGTMSARLRDDARGKGAGTKDGALNLRPSEQKALRALAAAYTKF